MRPRLLILPLLLASVVSCKKKVDLTAPGQPKYAASNIFLVQGDTQTVQGGTPLPLPIIVRATDAQGHPSAGTNVQFVIGGGGTATPTSLGTDSLGQAATKWILGPLQPSQTLTVTAAGVSAPLIVHATAIFPTSVTVAQGANQTGKSGVLLPVPVIVRVTGPNNTPMVNINVTVQVSNGGIIAPASGVTDASGQFMVKWTLGSNPGTNTLTVNAGNLPSVTISATGT